jgi:hypothetical protein
MRSTFRRLRRHLLRRDPYVALSARVGAAIRELVDNGIEHLVAQTDSS